MFASIENKQIKRIDKSLLKINDEMVENEINKILLLFLLFFINYFFSDVRFFYELYQSNINFKSFLYIVFWKGIVILLATFSYLKTYMKIKENGKTISIYEKLKYIPIKFENITFVRIQYLLKHTSEVLAIYIVSNFIGGIFIQEIDINVNLIIWLIVYSSLFVLIFGLLPAYLKVVLLNRKKGKILYKNDINKNVVFVFNILKWIIRTILILALLGILYFVLLIGLL